MMPPPPPPPSPSSSPRRLVVALSSAPITIEEAQNDVQVRMKRAFRAKPPKILRPRLTQDFAVLLMRSSYNVLDELDCVPMDQFQRDFFIIRQAEYELYVNQLGVGFVQQGDLTNPYYVRQRVFLLLLTTSHDKCTTIHGGFGLGLS